jgi:hypothetical protein
MGTSTYDPCLLITKDENGPFGLVGMQTDDTLILGDNEFVKQEDVELKRAKLLAKPFVWIRTFRIHAGVNFSVPRILGCITKHNNLPSNPTRDTTRHNATRQGDAPADHQNL